MATKKSSAPAPLVYVANLSVPGLPSKYRANSAISRKDGKPLTEAELEALRTLYPRKAASKRALGRSTTPKRRTTAKRRAARR